MSKIVSLDPAILSALISGFVSILISSVTGFFVLLRSSRELEKLRKQKLIEGTASAFVAARKEFISRSGQLWEAVNRGVRSSEPESLLQVFDSVGEILRLTQDYVTLHEDYLPEETPALLGEAEELSMNMRPELFVNDRAEFAGKFTEYLGALHAAYQSSKKVRK